MSEIITLSGLISLLTLSTLEVVLGIDNIIFISIFAEKLPAQQRNRARTLGLILALVLRIILLFSITWIIRMSEPIVTLMEVELSVKDFILLAGGLFLIVKTILEMHEKLEGDVDGEIRAIGGKFMRIIIQIALIDVVFSIDSILTAVGLVRNIYIMVLAVIIAIGFMMIFSKAVSGFIHRHPTLKILALAFLLLIGFVLMLEAFHIHVPKGYIYFAMFFAFLVEMLNMQMRKKNRPVELNEPTISGGSGKLTTSG